jgi:hypothetical protein
MSIYIHIYIYNQVNISENYVNCYEISRKNESSPLSSEPVPVAQNTPLGIEPVPVAQNRDSLSQAIEEFICLDFTIDLDVYQSKNGNIIYMYMYIHVHT